MSTQPPIGVGVIGLGFMGRTHLAAFNACPGCEVVAVADRDASRLKSGGDVGGNFDTGAEGPAFDEDVVSTFEDALELIEHPDVELVSVTTPTPTHRDLARAVMGAGRHLILEKPVDLDPAVIDELADEARKSGVLVMPAHCMRFWPAWAWMKRHLDAGTYGTPIRALFKRTGAAPGWNREFYLNDDLSGGAIIDLHIHDVDFIRHCFGMPACVSASGSRRHVVTEYGYGEGGIQVSAEGGWLEDDDAPFTMRCTIECTKGTMDFDLSRSPEIEVTALDGARTGYPEASEGGTGYDGEIRAMVTAVRNGAELPPVRLEDAADVARILAAEVHSLEADGAVAVESGR